MNEQARYENQTAGQKDTINIAIHHGHGLLLFVMSFNIIEWEMLKISNFFFLLCLDS